MKREGGRAKTFCDTPDFRDLISRTGRGPDDHSCGYQYPMVDKGDRGEGEKPVDAR